MLLFVKWSFGTQFWMTELNKRKGNTGKETGKTRNFISELTYIGRGSLVFAETLLLFIRHNFRLALFNSRHDGIEMEEIRSMWCDTLEELLQCPVCLETAANTKGQCVNGHHICSSCKTHMNSCPLCKSHFITTRNLAVEHISAKLEEIKLSLLHPYHALNRRILKGKVCAATQTEDTSKSTSYASASCQTEPSTSLKETLPQIEPQQEQKQQLTILSPKVGKGMYPCRIGSCTVELPHGRMISHLRYFHKDSFYEFSNRSNMFKQTWNLDYNISHDYDYAFFVRGMGLFFLHLSVDYKGSLMGAVLIVNCNEAAKQFMYTLKLGNGPQGARHTAAVKSCRTRREVHTDCLYIHDGDMRHITYNGIFRCELTINRKNGRRVNIMQENLV